MDNVQHDKAARIGAINTLKNEMIVLMETYFEADFTQRIPVSLQPVQQQLQTFQNKLNLTFSGANDRIIALEEEMKVLKNEHVKNTSLLVAYVEIPEHMDQSHATLN